MNALFPLFFNNLLPVFLAAGTGFLLARRLKVPARPLSQAVFYIFSPCLIFQLLTTSQLEAGEIGRMVLFTVATITAMGCLAWVVGRLLKYERKILAASVMTTMFGNAGNFGLAVVLFAFGDKALAYAGLFFATNALLGTSLGSVIASLGSSSLSDSLKILLKIPSVYALLLGLIVMSTGWTPPLPVTRVVNVLSDASIPGMLVVLGMQLHASQWGGKALPIGLTVGLTLVAAPLVAVLVSGLLGMTGPARSAAILEASMPSAVMNTIIATEYDLKPSFVTGVVFFSTLLSPLTLTPLMYFLGAK